MSHLLPVITWAGVWRVWMLVGWARVCVCVCVRDRERERKWERES